MATIDFNLSTETVTSNSGVVTVGDANGALALGAGTGIAATVQAGMLRWNSGQLEVSNGTSWLAVTTSSGGGGTSGLSGDDAFAIAVALS